MEGVHQVLTETTKWSDGTKNHTYLLNKAGKCVGYIKRGTEKLIKFQKPMFFDKRKRTFKIRKINKGVIDA